jgi:hypothetical protein
MDDCSRRVSPVAPRPREGPLTEPTAVAQPWRRERVLLPLSRRSGSSKLVLICAGVAKFGWRHLARASWQPRCLFPHVESYMTFRLLVGADATPSPIPGR